MMTAEQAPASATDDGDRAHTRFLLVLLALVTGSLWILRLPASLWLDETGTVWVIADGFGEAVDRAATFQGQTPLYYAAMWLVRTLFGSSEIVLRLPSVLGAALAAYFVARLGRRLVDRQTGLLAALIFVSLGPVAFAGAEARPYALALAALTGSVLALVRWADAPRPKTALVYAGSVVLTAALHYLFVIPLLAHGAYLLARRARGTGVGARAIAGVAAAGALFATPFVPQLVTLAGRRESLDIEPPNLTAVFLPLIVQGAVVAGLLVGSGLARALDRSMRVRLIRGAPVGLPTLLLAWFALPSVLLYGITVASDTPLIQPRYYLPAMPGLALLVAWALRGITPARARRFALTAVVIGALAAFPPLDAHDEGWREAMALVNARTTGPATPVLVRSAFVESLDVEWVRDPQKASFLLAPVAAYPVDGRAIALPMKVDEGTIGYMKELATDLVDTNSFFLVSRDDQPFLAWLADRLGPDGYHTGLSVSFGRVHVVEFVRPTQSPTGGPA